MNNNSLSDLPVLRGAYHSAIAVFTALMLSLPSTGFAANPDPADYPGLSKIQMGHLRHMINIANDLPGDFSLLGQMDPVYHMSFHAYQFQFAFAHYALASAHYHYTPAHRDLYQEASAKLIKRMIYKDVWDYWAHVSKFDITDRTNESGENVWRTGDDWYGWIDPNIKKNIMYSGHLLQMVGLHETLFDDHRYDEPGSLTFRYAPIEYGESPLEIKYDHNRLTKVIHDQFKENHFIGIECERNAIYAECNQHPILGLMSYDQKHRTKLAPDVIKGFKKVMVDREYIDPENNATMLFLKVREDEIVRQPLAWSDGWNGHAQHVWDAEYIKSIYPDQQKRYIPSMLYGEPKTNMGYSASFDFGWFMLLASEVGDAETVKTMADYADEHFKPIWLEGGYYYPAPADYLYNFSRTDKGVIQNVGPVTGNVLIGFSRINPKDGLWSIYNKPFDKSHYKNPHITDVEYLEASVTRAIYDDQKDALIVTLAPGPVESKTTSFTVRQLNPKKTYTLIRDGKKLGNIKKRRKLPAGTRWQKDGSLLISTTLKGEQSFVIRAN